MSGISRLAYLGFEVSDVPAWERFATGSLGLVVGDRRDDGSLTLRMDERSHRITLHPGPADDLSYVGFEVDDETQLRELASTLTSAGVEVHDASTDAAERGVDALVRLDDPNGVPIELATGSPRGGAFRSDLVPSGFVTGEEGMGHVVIAARDPQATDRFYRELLGFRLSDHIEVDLAPDFRLQITFLHANPRHHTVAFAAAPLPKRIHHFMIEAAEMGEVGLAYDRCLDAGVPIANTLGQHPNDLMFSFYATTPSGFDVEFGWGGRKIDDAVWETSTYDRLSTWGHRPPQS